MIHARGFGLVPLIDRFSCGFLVVTYACNNRCTWCYASPSGFGTQMMELEFAKTMLERMRDMGVQDVGLIGGEPTVYPGIEKLIAHGKSLGLTMTLYSNGRMLAKPAFADKIAAAGADYVNLSVQGGRKGKEKHDQIVRAKGAWEETYRGIINCRERGLKLRLQTVLCHSDFSQYQDLLDEYAFTRAKFIFYREVPIVDAHMFEYKVLPNAETKRMYDQVYQYAQQLGLDTYLFARMPLCWWDRNDPVERAIIRHTVSRCHVLSGENLIADVNGKTLPCPQWIGKHSMDLKDDSGAVKSPERILSDWNCGIPQQIRDNLLYYSSPNCANCEFYATECTGGCPLVPFEIGPFAPAADPSVARAFAESRAPRPFVKNNPIQLNLMKLPYV